MLPPTLWMSKYCFRFSEKKNASENGKSRRREKRKKEKKGAKPPQAAPHSACVLCVYCTSVWVYMRVCPIVCMCEFVLYKAGTRLCFFFFFFSTKRKIHQLGSVLKTGNNLTRKFRLEKLRLKMYIFMFKIQREGERTFHFRHTLKSQSHLSVCLLAPTFPMYMIKKKFYFCLRTTRIQLDPGEFSHPQGSGFMIECCLWYLNVVDGEKYQAVMLSQRTEDPMLLRSVAPALIWAASAPASRQQLNFACHVRFLAARGDFHKEERHWSDTDEAKRN